MQPTNNQTILNNTNNLFNAGLEENYEISKLKYENNLL